MALVFKINTQLGKDVGINISCRTFNVKCNGLKKKCLHLLN